MVISIRLPAARSLALVVGGTLLGTVLSAPVVVGITRPSEPATDSGQTVVRTRVASCMGRGFMPDHSTAASTYGVSGPTRSGEGAFVCDPHLPHRATVTRVRFTLIDFSDTGEVAACRLFRGSLVPTGDPDVEIMAQVASTGLTEEPGAVRRRDTTISTATIDNTKWAYLLTCALTEASGQLTIVGADVTYTISSANG